MSVLRRTPCARPFVLNSFQSRWLPAHALLLGLLGSPVLLAGEEDAARAQESSSRAAPLVITSAAPDSPVTVVTDPQQPRQPVPATDGTDYLKTIPGFAAVRNGGVNGDPVFRGMFGSRINVLTNGTLMLGACPNRMDSPSSYITPQSYDRLTVIKGPQTVLWGQGTSAATVLFERQPEQFSAPDYRLGGSLVLGSNGRFDRNIDAAVGSQDGYIRLLGTRSQANDYDDGNGDRLPSQYDKWSNDLVLGWTPDANTVLELTAGTGDGEASYAGRSMDGSQFKRESLGLRFEKSYIGEVFHAIEAQVYYNYADHVMDNFSLRDPDPAAAMVMMRYPLASNVDRRTAGGRVVGTWRFEEAELKAGVDGQFNQHRKRASSYNMMSGVYTDYDRYRWTRDADIYNFGAFGELNWKLDRQNRIVSGLRVDQAAATDYRASFTSLNTAVMPMVMTTWANPNAGSTRHDTLYSGFARYEQDLVSLPATWFAGIGHAERFPDYWELFSASAGPVGSAQAFAYIKPEKTTQLDLGIQYQQGPLQLWANAYVGQIDDYLLFSSIAMPMNMTRNYVENVDADIAGAELGGGYRLTPNWKGEASLAWAWGENRTDGTALPQMPPLEAKFSLTWARDDLSATGLWRLVAAQNRVAEDQGNVIGKDFGPSSGFGVLAVNAAWQASEQLKFSAGIDNLLDKAYSEHLNLAGNAGFGFPADTAVNEPGRTAWLRMDVSF